MQIQDFVPQPVARDNAGVKQSRLSAPADGGEGFASIAAREGGQERPSREANDDGPSQGPQTQKQDTSGSKATKRQETPPSIARGGDNEDVAPSKDVETRDGEAAVSIPVLPAQFVAAVDVQTALGAGGQLIEGSTQTEIPDQVKLSIPSSEKTPEMDLREHALGGVEAPLKGDRADIDPSLEVAKKAAGEGAAASALKARAQNWAGGEASPDGGDVGLAMRVDNGSSAYAAQFDATAGVGASGARHASSAIVGERAVAVGEVRTAAPLHPEGRAIKPGWEQGASNEREVFIKPTPSVEPEDAPTALVSVGKPEGVGDEAADVNFISATKTAAVETADAFMRATATVETVAASQVAGTANTPDPLAPIEPSVLDEIPLVAVQSEARNVERSSVVAPLTTVANSPDMARHVAGQIADIARISDDGIVEVMLRPEELGRLTLSFNNDGGAMTVGLSAERPETLELLKRNIDQLDSALQELGYRDISYDFSDGGGDADTSRQADRFNGSGRSLDQSEGQSPDKASILNLNTRAASGGIDIRL